MSHNLLLDFNEYYGEIHPNTKNLFHDLDVLRHYPDVLNQEIEDFFSHKFQVQLNDIHLTNGADDGLFHCLSALSLQNNLKSVKLYETPTYDHFLSFAKGLNYKIVSPAEKADLIYLCTPNNPSGHIIQLDELHRICELNPHSHILLDLTYAYYSPISMETYVDFARNNPQFTLLFSLNKTYPSAGTRMGVLISFHKGLQKYFSHFYNKKLVNTLSRNLIKNCIENDEFYKIQRSQIFNNRFELLKNIQSFSNDLQIQLLNNKSSLENLGGNFLKIYTKKDQLTQLTSELYKRGIIARHKEHWDFIRLTSVSNSFLKEIQSLLLNKTPFTQV